MNKQEIISILQKGIEEDSITKNEINQIFDVSTSHANSTVPHVEPKDDQAKNLINIFYGIGALIVLIGVVILVAQNWYEIGFVGRIGVTLGIALGAYILGFILKDHEQKILSPLAFVVSAILAPLGAYVLCDEFAINISLNTQIAITTIMTVLFANALLITKKKILILVTMGYSSCLYLLLFTKLFESRYLELEWMKWAVMLLGVAYLLISYGLSNSADTAQEKKEVRSIQRVLYSFGALGILGTGIVVGGIFDILFIAIVFGMFYLSTYVKSREMLSLASVFLMAHIIKLTSKYFADTISWPIALIGVGFMIISIGYATFYINKNFISKDK